MTTVSLIGSNPARREVRDVLERAGIQVVAEADTVDDVADRSGDVQVVQEPRVTNDGAFEEALTAREREDRKSVV